jgi:hypothetical protein
MRGVRTFICPRMSRGDNQPRLLSHVASNCLNVDAEACPCQLVQRSNRSSWFPHTRICRNGAFRSLAARTRSPRSDARGPGGFCGDRGLFRASADRHDHRHLVRGRTDNPPFPGKAVGQKRRSGQPPRQSITLARQQRVEESLIALSVHRNYDQSPNTKSMVWLR